MNRSQFKRLHDLEARPPRRLLGVHDMTDAELEAVIGLGPSPCDAELRRVAGELEPLEPPYTARDRYM